MTDYTEYVTLSGSGRLGTPGLSSAAVSDTFIEVVGLLRFPEFAPFSSFAKFPHSDAFMYILTGQVGMTQTLTLSGTAGLTVSPQHGITQTLELIGHADLDTRGLVAGLPIRYPTGDGSSNGSGWNPTPGSPTTLYDKVDDPFDSPDDWSTYIGCGTNGRYKLFTFTPFNIPQTATGIILRTWYRHGQQYWNPIGSITKSSIQVGGTVYSTDPGTTEHAITTCHYDWTVNPATGLAWVPDDINGIGSNPFQQFGVYCNNPSASSSASYVTQTYAQVYFSVPEWAFASGQISIFAFGDLRTTSIWDRTEALSFSGEGTIDAMGEIAPAPGSLRGKETQGSCYVLEAAPADSQGSFLAILTAIWEMQGSTNIIPILTSQGVSGISPLMLRLSLRKKQGPLPKYSLVAGNFVRDVDGDYIRDPDNPGSFVLWAGHETEGKYVAYKDLLVSGGVDFDA